MQCNGLCGVSNRSCTWIVVGRCRAFRGWLVGVRADEGEQQRSLRCYTDMLGETERRARRMSVQQGIEGGRQASEAHLAIRLVRVTEGGEVKVTSSEWSGIVCLKLCSLRSKVALGGARLLSTLRRTVSLTS